MVLNLCKSVDCESAHQLIGINRVTDPYKTSVGVQHTIDSILEVGPQNNGQQNFTITTGAGDYPLVRITLADNGSETCRLGMPAEGKGLGKCSITVGKLSDSTIAWYDIYFEILYPDQTFTYNLTTVN